MLSHSKIYIKLSSLLDNDWISLDLLANLINTHVQYIYRFQKTNYLHSCFIKDFIYITFVVT